MNEVQIIEGSKLTQNLYKQMYEAEMRVFKCKLPPIEELANRKFFLLLDENKILSMGNILPFEPVIFCNKSYSLVTINGVISNVKGKGYGKAVVSAIHDEIVRSKKSCISCCAPYNQEFYIKCGFFIDKKNLKRVVFKDLDKEIRNEDGQVLFYIDGLDHFMADVHSNLSEDIIIPSNSIW